jgi:hypothetical protein
MPPLLLPLVSQATTHQYLPLTLALECLQEALEVQPAVRAKLNAMVEQGLEDADPERMRVVAKALLTRRLHEIVHLHDETYRENSLQAIL